MNNVSFKHKTPFINIENYKCEHETVNIIPEEMARYYQVVGLEKINNSKISFLTVGMVNPENSTAISILEHRLNCKILPIKIEVQEWANITNQMYERKTL